MVSERIVGLSFVKVQAEDNLKFRVVNIKKDGEYDLSY
jgi:hypothetical protein